MRDLAVFMGNVPAMHEKMVQKEVDQRNDDGCKVEMTSGITLMEESKSQEEPDADTQFPGEYETALRSAALAMAAELDEEEQETTAYDAYAQAKQYGGNIVAERCEAGLHTEHHEKSGNDEQQTTYYLALQVGIGEDKLLGEYGQKESNHEHSIERHVVTHTKQHASHHRDAHQVKEEQPAVRKEETVETHHVLVLVGSTEGEVDHLNE